MTRKVIKVGSSAAVTIPKALLKKLGLSIGDAVELESGTKGNVVLRPARTVSSRHEHIARLTFDFIERYRDDLEALARK